MEQGERWSLEQIRAFLETAEEIHFQALNRGELYEWIAKALCEQEYWKQNREAKGLLRQYLMKMSGLSRAQATRLIAQYVATER